MLQNDIVRIIVIEESANEAEMILNSLRRARLPLRPHHVEDDEDLQAALADQEWDLVIAVPTMMDFSIQKISEILDSSQQELPLLVLTRKFSAEEFNHLLDAGANRVIPADQEQSLQKVVKQLLSDLEKQRRLLQLEQLYRQSMSNNKILIESSRDAISYVHEGMHIHANPSYLKMFGYESLDDLEGMPVMDLVAPDDHESFKQFMREYMTDANSEDRDINLVGIRQLKNHKHKTFDLKMEVSQALYDGEKCIQIIIRDRSDSQALEKKIKELNKRDQLTQLYNRQYFIQLLDKNLGRAAESHTRSVLAFVSLDHFKKLREQFDIAALDEIQRQVATVLQSHSNNIYISRFSDGNYSLLLPEYDIKKAQDFFEKLKTEIEAQVIELENTSAVVTASIGLVAVLASAGTPQNVIADAQTACLQAAEQGGNRLMVYRPEVKSGDNNLTDMAKKLETALEEKTHLSLVYQPIASLRGETTAIYEVFLRMKDNEGKNIPIGQVFAAAEQAKLGFRLDQWILKESVIQLRQQLRTGNDTRLFIKLSDQTVRDKHALTYIAKLLHAAQVPGKSLVIEFNEALVISQVNYVKNFIINLQKMGCRAALEHFGTGLNYETTLKHLPVNYVKIDSSYAKDLASNSDSQVAVEKIVRLAHEHDKLTIAESVENASSLTILWQCETDYAQGHYISPPSEQMDYDFSEE